MPVTLIRPERLTAWNGPSLFVVNTHGECDDGDGLSGYFYRETRFLRTFRPTINAEQPWLCDASAISQRELLFTFIYPERTAFGGGGSGQADDEESVDPGGIPHRSQAVRVTYLTDLTGVRVLMQLTNHARRAVDYELAWDIDADFADIEEANAGRREQSAEVSQRNAGGGIELIYQHPQLPYRTGIACRGDDWTFGERRASIHVSLAPGETFQRSLEIRPHDAEGVISDVAAADRESAARAWRRSFAGISCPRSEIAHEIIQRSVDDFASLPMMDGDRDEWLTPQAGIPLYPAIFGRDAVTAGWQAAMLDRAESLDATLTFLGRRQSTRHDDWRDEEPGRTPHSLRRGPLGTLNLNPYAAYYGDMAGPLMYVIGLAHLYSWTGDAAVLRRHWDTARRILDWARTGGDKDRDGYLEYQTRSAKGAKNQGWKDSGDAVVYDDGSNVPAPIASCELQGYWFAAQQLMAVMSVAMGDVGDARSYWRDAAALKARFNRDWWLEAEGSVALALDPDKRLIRAATSNIGHCLASGIISAEHVPALVGRLFAPDMFSGWGVRTLSSTHRFYDPLSYHRGSVWPVEQATIAFGLRRFGFARRANELTEAMFDLATHYSGYRLPECIGGYSRGEHAAPGAYPRANPLQLWNATAVPLFIHSMLGLQPVAPLELLAVDPQLPAWLPEIVLTDLRLAGATVTLRFWRDSRGASHAKVIRKRGTFRLIKQPPPESLEDDARDRVAALFDTLVH